MSDARLRLRTLSSPEEILPLVAEVDGQSFSYLQFVMVFLKFAVVDPDVVRPSTAESGASFFRVEDSFQRGQTIHAIFLEACESVFLHLTISKERGLQSTIFCGRDRDSGSNISLAVHKEFTQMHGRGDFSSLPCNSFNNIDLLLQADNRSRNGK